MKTKTALLIGLFTIGAMAAKLHAQSEEREEAADQEPQLAAEQWAQLADQHDVVAVIQVDETKYERSYDVPTSGFADVRVLLAYKGVETGEYLRVYEAGLKDTKREKAVREGCFYPQRLNEGHRFLAFLNRDEEAERELGDQERFVGSLPACRIPLLVTTRMEYAMPVPSENIEVPPDVEVKELEFNDPEAYFGRRSMSASRVDAMLESNSVRETIDGRLVFTRGVVLSDLRPLFFPDGLPSAR